MLNKIGAKDLVLAIDKAFEESGIDTDLEQIGVPGRVVPQIALELATYANGPLMKGGLSTPAGRRIMLQKIDNMLHNLFASTADPQPGELFPPHYEAVIGKIMTKMEELSTPDEHDIKTNNTMFTNTIQKINSMLRGTSRLEDPSLPYNTADITIISNLLEAIRKLRSGENVEGIERMLKDFSDFSDDLTIQKSVEEVYSDILDDLGNIDKLENLAYVIDRAQHIASNMQRTEDPEALMPQQKAVKDEIDVLIAELEQNHIIFNDVSDFGSILRSIARYRQISKNKVESRIERYKDIPGVADQLFAFRDVMTQSEAYQRARMAIDRAATGTDDLANAEQERDRAYGAVKHAMKTAKLSIADAAAEGDRPHYLTTDELGHFSQTYKERQKIYDMLIQTRNRILGRGVTREEQQENFVSIISKLIAMTRQYNKAPKEITAELLDRRDQYVEFKKMRQKRSREAEPTIKIPVYIEKPGGTQRITGILYPSLHNEWKYEKLRGAKETVDAKMLNPARFMDRDSVMDDTKTQVKIVFDNLAELEERFRKAMPDDEMEIDPEEEFEIKETASIVRDMELDIDEHDELMEYLNSSEPKTIVIGFE
jgi:hypothetical protein